MQKLIIKILVLASFLTLFSCGATRHIKSGLNATQIGEYSRAIDSYKKAYKREKNRDRKLEINYEIAKCAIYLGDYRLAESNLRNCVRRAYHNDTALFYYGEALRANKKYEDALLFYRQFLDSVGNDERTLLAMKACDIIPQWTEKPTRFEVENLKRLNSREADYAPSFVGGIGNDIVFTSTRKDAVGRKKSGITGQRHADLFKATYNIQKQRWDDPKLLDEELIINSADEEGASSIIDNGSLMYFTRCRYDKRQATGAEIYSAKNSKGDWSEPTLVNVVADTLSAAHPALSAAGNEMYFVSDMPGGLGGNDIWRVTGSAGSWGEPENLGAPINTPGNEMFPYIRDNGELYFSSDYHLGMGGLDIFKATKENGSWKIENLKYPMNSEGDDFGIVFLPGENKGMFSSNRDGARGDDIYSFVLPPKIFRVEGEIVDNDTESRINDAYVRIIGTDGTMLKVRSEEGKFQYRLKPDVEYIFASFKDGFLNAKQLVSTVGLDDSKVFDLKFSMASTDSPIKVDNINYEFGKWELSNQSMIALDSLVQILDLNPTIVIELMSHTDHVGADQFNSELSQKRAQAVVNFLIERGINPKRLVAKGYGETWPKKVTRNLAKEYDFLKRNDVLTEEFINQLESDEQKEIAQSLNRRTEFRVISFDFRETFDPNPEK